MSVKLILTNISSKIDTIINKLESKTRRIGIVATLAIAMSLYLLGFIVMQDHKAGELAQWIYLTYGLISIFWIELYLLKLFK